MWTKNRDIQEVEECTCFMWLFVQLLATQPPEIITEKLYYLNHCLAH